MNANGCFAVILFSIGCIGIFLLGCLITYDCAFYERECTITIDNDTYVKSYERILCEVRKSQKSFKDEFKTVEFSFQAVMKDFKN